jgi:glycosyltransferase involved in cell wall biosynthesis
VHHAIRAALAADPVPDLDAEFLDVPAPGIVGRVLRHPIPGLAALDLDLAPLRAQLVLSAWVRSALRRRGIDDLDVLHVYTQHAALRSVDALRARASVVSTDASGVQVNVLHPDRDPTRFTPTRVRLAARLEQRVFDAATMVVAHSQWAAASLRDDFGVTHDRLAVVPFGIVMAPEAPRRTGEGLPEITFVANSMTRKGGWRLLRLFRTHLAGRCVLNLVTPEAVEPEPGVRVLRDIQVGDGRLAELLASTRVLAFPSEMDTWGYAAIEAMAVGVPVVGLRLAALPEIVVDGETGILVDPGDDAALVEALRTFVDDAAVASRMGDAARRRALEHFDARVTTRQLCEVLTEARRRHRGS